MSEIDLLIFIVILFSAMLGFLRGFLREMLGLIPWLFAFFVALFYTKQFSLLLPIDSVQSLQARTALSASILFLGILIVGLLIKWMFNRAMGVAPVKQYDRITGGFFGFCRGVFIVTVLTLGANLIPEIKQETWWQDSRLLPRFQKVAKAMHAQLPSSVGQHFDLTSTGF